VVNPTQGIYNGKANPCNTIPNLFYYPLPDNTKYIHCDDFGDAFEKTCPNNFIWSLLSFLLFNNSFKTACDVRNIKTYTIYRFCVVSL
jgi:hypothetical protein